MSDDRERIRATMWPTDCLATVAVARDGRTAVCDSRRVRTPMLTTTMPTSRHDRNHMPAAAMKQPNWQLAWLRNDPSSPDDVDVVVDRRSNAMFHDDDGWNHEMMDCAHVGVDAEMMMTMVVGVDVGDYCWSMHVGIDRCLDSGDDRIRLDNVVLLLRF